MSESESELLDMVEECMLGCEFLTDWETQFIDSVSLRLDNGQEMSQSQQKKLAEIWKKVRDERRRWYDEKRWADEGKAWLR